MKITCSTTGILLLFFFLQGCGGNNEKAENIINYDHLKHLYLEVDLPNGRPGGVFHIYSEYPDYRYEIEPDEGFSCVDDVARAMVLQSMLKAGEKIKQGMHERNAEFLLYMLNDNGYFNNFIWHDLGINETYQTSVASPNWWSWRAFWALSTFTTDDKDLEDRVKKACKRHAENISREYADTPLDTLYFSGMAFPSWLPLQSAGDQAAVLILGLVEYYNHISPDPWVPGLIGKFADGLLLTQKGDENTFPYGAFLSWRDLWHAYGNIQSYALLTAGEMLHEDKYVQSALLEIDHFYPYLAEKGHIREFYLEFSDGEYLMSMEKTFPQIAYDFRPMVWACLKASDVTGNDKYVQQALELSRWFAGSNIAGQEMYDPRTGRCYDGIISPDEVNLNSGAESTIEALLTLKMLQEHLDDNEFNSIYEQ